MNNAQTRNFLIKLFKAKTLSRKQLNDLSFHDESISSMVNQELITLKSDPLYHQGHFAKQESDIFMISDKGHNYLEEFYFRNEPLKIARRSQIISIIAVAISLASFAWGALR